ncbi:MFS transporter [Yimella sp. cx-573]|nr:MFS transporter [Yimella sp. cx-573]
MANARAREVELGAPFKRYWTAAAISSFGASVTAVAMPVFVVQHLQASAFEVGLVNAAQLIPYAVLGLLAGAYVDRWRRKPILIWSSIGRAVSLGVIPLLWLADVLQTWMLIGALLFFGAFSVFGFAATQSLLPRLVPRNQLVTANSRLDQTDAGAQTLGPAVGGALIGVVGAPVALVVDSVSYLVEAALVTGVKVDEPRPTRTARNLHTEIQEGLTWTYRHAILGRLAASTHVWFLANGAAMTVLALLALRTLDFSAGEFGLLMALFGVCSLLGASAAPRIGGRLGAGRAVVAARVVYPVAWLLPIFASLTLFGHGLVFVALALLGFAAGVENSNEMGLWQSMTPDRLLGRVNATRRSVNRTMGAAGAVIGGTLVAISGDQEALVAVVVTFGVAALLVCNRRVLGAEVEC